MSENSEKNIIKQLENSGYEAGFVTDIEMDTFKKGLNEEVIKKLSALRNEPKEMLDFRLNAYRLWKTMKMPHWAHLDFEEPDYQDLIYYAKEETETQ